MTLQNWNDVMFMCLSSSKSGFICTLYMISWIMIGFLFNYLDVLGNSILLNLFLAILLDGF